jgi:hypothetical protein
VLRVVREHLDSVHDAEPAQPRVAARSVATT